MVTCHVAYTYTRCSLSSFLEGVEGVTKRGCCYVALGDRASVVEVVDVFERATPTQRIPVMSSLATSPPPSPLLFSFCSPLARNSLEGWTVLLISNFRR